MTKLLAMFVIACVQHTAFAETEYIRLTGTIDPGFPAILLPDGLVSGQFVYFDFEFDTEIDPDILGDDDNFEEFQISTYGGNYPVTAVVAWTGRDASSFIYRSIILEGPLDIEERIDCNFAIPPPQCTNEFEFDWKVGSTAYLTLNSYDIITSLEVAYRGNAPPPPIPLPASIWFMLSAILAMKACTRTRSLKQ